MANHRPTVLIVGDEPLIAMLYEDLLVDAGLSIGGCFTSCESAEEWLSIHSPDVAIIDIKLQDGCSTELEFRASTPSSIQGVDIDVGYL